MSRDASRPPGGQSAPTAEQLALLREVEAHREPFLQAWWAQRLWQGQRLRTASGAPLEVLEPGWLNRGGGPDFGRRLRGIAEVRDQDGRIISQQQQGSRAGIAREVADVG